MPMRWERENVLKHLYYILSSKVSARIRDVDNMSFS